MISNNFMIPVLGQVISWMPSQVKIALFALFSIGMVVLLIYTVRSVRSPRLKADPLLTPRLTIFFLLVMTPLVVAFPPVFETVRLMFVDQSGISQIILIIMTAGIGIDLYQYRSLANELRSCQTILDSAQSLHNIHASNYLEKLQSIIREHATGNLLGKWRNLKDVEAHHDVADFELLMSFPNQSEFLREGKINFIIKLLPLLGMIGTIVGFVAAVVGMQSAAANMVNFESFKGNMVDALGGMRTAFVTTLAGLVGMIIVMFLNSALLESRRRILLMEDEFFYKFLFLPYKKNPAKKEESDE